MNTHPLHTKLSWPSKRKKNWNVVDLSSSKMKKVSLPKKTARSGCYTQGGVITEKYYVVSNFCGDSSSKNKVHFIDRKTKAITKTFTGKYGHMNALYYKWGTKHVRVKGKGNISDHCFQFGDKKSDFKEVKLANCKTKSQANYGVPKRDVNGKKLSDKKGSDRGHLTGQGQAVAGGYGFAVGWDAACSKWGQIWTHKRHTNALFVYNASNKNC